MLRLLLTLLIVLVVYALVDCVRHDETEMPVGLPKALWVVLIVVFPGAGALAWLVVSRVQRQAQRTGGPRHPAYGGPAPRPSPRRPATRPVAPDDDPDFLASLDRAQRRQQRDGQPHDEQHPEPGDDANGPAADTGDGADGTTGPADDTSDGATDGADDDDGPGTRH